MAGKLDHFPAIILASGLRVAAECRCGDSTHRPPPSALATGPNQLNRVGLELSRKLSPFPLRQVHLQAHYRAKSGVYESDGTSIVALNETRAFRRKHSVVTGVGMKDTTSIKAGSGKPVNSSWILAAYYVFTAWQKVFQFAGYSATLHMCLCIKASPERTLAWPDLMLHATIAAAGAIV